MPKDVKTLKLIELLKQKLALLRQQLSSIQKNDTIKPLIAIKLDMVFAEMVRRGLPMKVSEGFRSIERQNALYAQGRTIPGNVVTNAKGGESFHNYGVAVDCIFQKDGWNAPDAHWKIYGQVAKSFGFEWGGDWVGFQDRPHIQMTLGYTLADFQNNKVDYSKFN